MSMAESGITVEILNGLREDVRALRADTSARFDDLDARFDATNERLDVTIEHLDVTNKRLDGVEGTLLRVARVQRSLVREVRAISEREAREGRVDELESK
jgi:hypothetical protein